MKLSEITIENFKGIGDPISIKIDNIVALIGNNNVGKTTILSAYEAFASTSSKLSIKDFYLEDPEKVPTITGIFETVKTGEMAQKWIYNDEEKGYKDCIKVQYRWTAPDIARSKFSYDPEIGEYTPNGTGGFDTILVSRIPRPIKISPLEDPMVLEGKIMTILTESIKSNINQNQGNLKTLIDQIEILTNTIMTDIEEDINESTKKIAEELSKVFPEFNHVQIDIKPSKIEAEKLIAAGSIIRVGSQSEVSELNYSVPLSHHGTGLQRTFLWSALKMLADSGQLKNGKTLVAKIEDPKILLIEEPEAFLHPSAIREAREALYAIADLNDWQVMTTTHSPMFIDLTKDHTTIIRIEKDESATRTVKTFSTEDVDFTSDERENLNMLNFCNPYFNEFFFAKQNLLVEGETEYTIAKFLQKEAGLDPSLHILNCIGKGNIVTVAKILNHFKVPYAVLHDSDNPTTEKKVSGSTNKTKVRNGAWTSNIRIIEEVEKGRLAGIKIKTFVSIPNFEGEFLEGIKGTSKPYEAYKYFQSNYSSQSNANVIKFVDLLKVIFNDEIQDSPLYYENMETIDSKVLEHIAKNNLHDNTHWDLEFYNSDKTLVKQ